MNASAGESPLPSPLALTPRSPAIVTARSTPARRHGRHNRAERILDRDEWQRRERHDEQRGRSQWRYGRKRVRGNWHGGKRRRCKWSGWREWLGDRG
jgi:hypothetical protein